MVTWFYCHALHVCEAAWNIHVRVIRITGGGTAAAAATLSSLALLVAAAVSVVAAVPHEQRKYNDHSRQRSPELGLVFVYKSEKYTQLLDHLPLHHTLN